MSFFPIPDMVFEPRYLSDGVHAPAILVLPQISVLALSIIKTSFYVLLLLLLMLLRHMMLFLFSLLGVGHCVTRYYYYYYRC